MKIPNKYNWLSRDASFGRKGELYASISKPFKRIVIWDGDQLDNWLLIEETDDTYSHIQWEDDEPTPIKNTQNIVGGNIID